jgi:gliding motility-associatede transport system auxiliary component
MATRTQQRLGATSLILLFIAFFIAVIVSNQLFKGVRIDLTANHLYTLSDGTKRILGNIDEPIDLYYYFSNEATKGVPATRNLRDYASRVQEMLEEFVDESGGKLHLNVIDPVPFSEDEDRAAQFGLQGAQLESTPDPVYLGLAGTNSVGNQESIAFIDPEKEATLEYDLAKLVSTLANPQRKIVGLVSGVSMTGQFNPRTQRMSQPWVVYQQAQQLFEIRDLGTSFDAVPDDIGVLWIVQPKNLSAATQYAIDQFVMHGGRALIFVDPLAAVDPAESEGMPQGMPPMGQSSNLGRLFKGWGIDYDPHEVVADAELALPVSTGMSNRPTRHYAYLGFTADNMNSGDVVTADLGSIYAAMAGQLKAGDGATATFEPLLSSTASSSTMPSSRFMFLPDPLQLQQGFTPGGKPLVIAARIGGTLPSAFPEGKPKSDAEGSDAKTADGNEDAKAANESDGKAAADAPDAAAGPLKQSAEPVNLIVVADVDMLSDSLWVRVQQIFGQQIASAFANNGAFVMNALESLVGSTDLISVRSRGSFSRPFTRVEKLRADAESKYQETEKQLQQELAETERRLGELQSSREDTGSLLVTDEQQAEIDRFIDQRASIRKELRAVQRGLDADIERLGTWLKIINIGLVPLLLTLITLIALWHRRRKSP